VRLSDLLSLPLAALWQQKSRTILTTLGVVFGSFVLAASLSVGQGVQDKIELESHRSDFLRRINVSPGHRPTKPDQPAVTQPVEGTMSEAKRDRLRRAIDQHNARWGNAVKPNLPLTRDKLAELAALPHVQDITPNMWLWGHAILDHKGQSIDIQPARIEDAFFQERVIAGRYFQSSSEQSVLVSEYLLYRLGVTDEAAVKSVVGKKLRLEVQSNARQPGFAVILFKPEGAGEITLDEEAALDKIRHRLPTALASLGLTPAQIQLLQKSLKGKSPWNSIVATEELEIAGVLRAPTAEEEHQPWNNRAASDVVLPVQTASDLYFRIPGYAEQGLNDVVVRVDDEQYTKQVFERIKELGWDARAPLDFVEQQRLQYLLIFSGMTCVAAVALLVAALGIANTMLMSVLERTREIGIMKAVGASNGQLQFIFLVEGALIGLVGGVVGLLLAWGASFPGDAWVRSMVSRNMTNVELKEALFVFPSWLLLAVISFAVLTTTLAAVYPARRAANVDPVGALRHE
jgi:putative ABC transport system permease protein